MSTISELIQQKCSAIANNQPKIYSKGVDDTIRHMCARDFTSVEIPEDVTSMKTYAFYGCSSLTSVYIKDIAKWCGISFEGATANPLAYAHNLYHNGKLVTELVIPNNVTSISDYAFSGCTSLASITIHDNMENIGYHAFDDCTGLTSVYITDIAKWCKIVFDGVDSNPLTYAKNLYLIKDGTPELVTHFVTPNDMIAIGNSIFSGCSNLTGITISDNVTSIGTYTFSGCSGLTNVIIPDNVTSIGNGAFKECTSLESITIPFVGTTKDGTSNTNFGYIFGGTVNYNATAVPSSLKTVVVTGGTKIAERAFDGCSNIESITIPNSVTNIGRRAFNGCSNLNAIYINDVSAWCNISLYDETSNPLYCAGNLYLNGELATNLAIPEGTASIGDFAFYNCTSLMSVTIPNSVTSISKCAFQGCSSLTSVTIGNGVTSIEFNAFYGCSKLTDVYYAGSEAEWQNISIGSSNDSLTNATIHYNSAI